MTRDAYLVKYGTEVDLSGESSAVNVNYYTVSTTGSEFTGFEVHAEVEIDFNKVSVKKTQEEPGFPIGMWTDPSSLQIKKIGDAWYGSAHIDETIRSGLFKSVQLNTTVNFMFKASHNKKETQYLLAKDFDAARVAVLDMLDEHPGMSSAAAATEFKSTLGVSLMLTFWSSQVVTEFNYLNVPTFEVQFLWLPPFSPSHNN